MPTQRSSAQSSRCVPSVGGERAEVSVEAEHSWGFCTARAADESRAAFHLQMDENGIYKAMGEFDIFINYIEEYLLMRRRK